MKFNQVMLLVGLSFLFIGGIIGVYGNINHIEIPFAILFITVGALVSLITTISFIDIF